MNRTDVTIDERGVASIQARRGDETLVEALVARTRSDPTREAAVLQRMLRPRDPKGVYAEGGCIDTTREYPKGVSPQHCELVLPRY